MKTMYQTRAAFGNKIASVEVVKSTVKLVWIALDPDDPDRMRVEERSTRYDQFHDSWEEARDHLLSVATLEAEQAKSALDMATRRQSILHR